MPGWDRISWPAYLKIYVCITLSACMWIYTYMHSIIYLYGFMSPRRYTDLSLYGRSWAICFLSLALHSSLTARMKQLTISACPSAWPWFCSRCYLSLSIIFLPFFSPLYVNTHITVSDTMHVLSKSTFPSSFLLGLSKLEDKQKA